MKLKFTIKRLFFAFLAPAFCMSPFLLFAQSDQECENQVIYFSEPFTNASTTSPHPDVKTLTFSPTGDFYDEGTYRISDNLQLLPDWFNTGDHTGNVNGKMLIVNGESVDFYQKVITNASGFTSGDYSVSFYAINANNTSDEVCGVPPLVATFKIKLEYLDEGGSWVELGNSPVVSDPLDYIQEPTWKNIQGDFSLPPLGTFFPVQLRVTISDLMHGGCGNDFAIDDIKVWQCAEGGPMPVTFTNISTSKKGNSVVVNWGTAQEINNDRFEVERSGNGSAGWEIVETVKGAGTSQLEHQYIVTDNSPLAGFNYYRVKQVDIDGKSAYSKTVSIRIDNEATRISLIGNPFTNSFTLKFNGKSQQVNARLMDVTGKIVAKDVWMLPSGEIIKQFSNISNLHSGMYIITIQNTSGEILFNEKIMKR